MNSLQTAAFHYEIQNWNNIPIGSQNCGVGCIFCKVNNDPILRRFPELPPITLEDLEDGFQYLDPEYRFVRLGAGVLVAPHTDPYLHPEIYRFIHHTAARFPQKTVTTVTTGSYIELGRLEELRQIRNFGIDLSLVTVQPIRETIIPLATRDKLRDLLCLAPIRKVSLMFTGNLVDLQRDIEYLLSLDVPMRCEQVLVRRIEHTRFSPKKLRDLSAESMARYEAAVALLRARFPGVEYTVPYLEEAYRYSKIEYFSDAEGRLTRLRERILSEPQRYFHVVTPQSTHSYFAGELASFQNVTVYEVANQTYGGSVTVAGLLTNNDVLHVLDNFQIRNGLVVLPREMYDHDLNDLFGAPLSELGQRYGVEAVAV